MIGDVALISSWLELVIAVVALVTALLTLDTRADLWWRWQKRRRLKRYKSS